MNEIERVAQMVADGRITPEEGDRLIAVLKSVQAADEQMEATRAQLEDAAPDGAAPAGFTPAGLPAADPNQPSAPSAPNPTPLPAAPPRAPLPPSGAAAAVPEAAAAGDPDPARSAQAGPTQPGPAQPGPSQHADSAPPGTKWVRIEMIAGDLSVTVDPSLDAPRAKSSSSDVRLEPTDYGYRLASGAGPGALGGMFGRFRTGDHSVVLPAGYGVELAKTAGDIDLKDVPYLRGTLAAGDIDAHGLKGVDFSTLAGDVFLTLCPTSGHHRVQATAGEIEVVLLPGSDVAVKADVSMGDVTASAPFTTERSLVSEHLSGTVGAGSASLELKVRAGSIVVRQGADDE